MVSLAQGNTLRKSAFWSGFSLKIIVKLIISCVSNILKRFPPRFLADRQPQKFRVLSVLRG